MAQVLSSGKRPWADIDHQLSTSILASALSKSFGQCYCERTGIPFSVRKNDRLWYPSMTSRKCHEIGGRVHFVSEVVARWDHVLSVDTAVTLYVGVKREDLDFEIVIATFSSGMLTRRPHKRLECTWRHLAYLYYRSSHPYGRCGLHIWRWFY